MTSKKDKVGESSTQPFLAQNKEKKESIKTAKG